jgi:hypothetical protein
MAMLRFAMVMLLALVCRNGVAQEEFPFKALVFQGASAFRPGESVEYFLVKRGFLRGVSPDEEAAMIAHWTREHPNARLVPVSVLGERSRLPMVYAWAVDGEDNLNLLLVRQGVYPALAMLDTPQFEQLLERSKHTRYAKRLAAQERLGNPTGIPSRRLVSAPRYEDFMNKLVAAEAAAQADMVGIWSDQFKPGRDKMGLTPLATLETIK